MTKPIGGLDENLSVRSKASEKLASKFYCDRGHSHRSGQCVLRSRVNKVEGGVVVGVLEDVNLNPCEDGDKMLRPIAPTVRTGPKISSTIVMDLGSFVRITVGWMK